MSAAPQYGVQSVPAPQVTFPQQQGPIMMAPSATHYAQVGQLQGQIAPQSQQQFPSISYGTGAAPQGQQQQQQGQQQGQQGQYQ